MDRKDEFEAGQATADSDAKQATADSDETGKSEETQRPSDRRRFLSVLGWLWKRASIVVSLGLLLAAFLFGLVIGRGDLEGPATKGSQDAALPLHDHGAAGGTEGGAAERAVEMWTCSMHPQIRQPKPGLCPICNMELVPVKSGGGGERSLVMTQEGRKLAEITTAPVERKALSAVIRLVGTVDYDETRVKEIAAWVPGRIDHLYADFMGKLVQAGQPLVELYSPDLYVAQKELLLARPQAGAAMQATIPALLLVAARDKLRLAGVTSEQIREIEERGTASDKQVITAPIGGTIVRKMVNEGTYVATGTPLLTVADLSVVWVRLQAFESDLPWLHAGQDVAVTTDAFPGVELTGRIVFIDPYIDAASRTGGVRVEVPNPDGLLKPEMFARAEVRADLVDAAGGVPLVVPATAVLLTDKRAVVYVEEPNAEEPTYTGRTVTVGTRAADWYVVLSGLSEGERVVTNGAFKINADLQIQAKPSMMSMPSEPLAEAVPMAFDNRGADWLQPDDKLLNPYFGSTMLRCGEQKKSFPGMDGKVPEVAPMPAGHHHQ